MADNKQPVRVLITGAAGQIAYSLIFMIAKGDMLGADQPVILHLLDIPFMQEALHGVVLEIEDCALPLVRGVVATTDVREAFTDVDYALLVGAMPRKEGMERADLLRANAAIFKVQGNALNQYSSKNVKVLVVGNPANTNCLLALTTAAGLPRENFSCLTRLDHNRAKAQVAIRTHTSADKVHNVIIWGNHSSTQYPDVNHGTVVDASGNRIPVRQAVNDDAYLNGDFIRTVQQRGAAIIKARKLSSAASASKAIVDHMRDWIFGTPAGEFVSMGVYSNGNPYGVADNLIYSFPVTVRDGRWHFVEGLQIDDFSRAKMHETEEELKSERDQGLEILAHTA